MLRRLTSFLLLLVACGVAPAAAQARSWTVESPAGDLRAVVGLDSGSGLTLAVRAGGRPLLAAAPLGLVTGAGELGPSLRLRRASPTVEVSERYRTLVGKRRRHRSRLSERRFVFSGPGGAWLELHVRVAADGVAYRYRLPGRGVKRVLAERSAWRFPSSGRAWLSPYQDDTPRPDSKPSNLSVYYEAPRTQLDVQAAAGDYVYPALFELPRGRFALVTESALDVGYAGTHLRSEGDGLFRVAMPSPEGGVEARGPLVTPWRVAMIGSLASLVESDLVQDLAPASRLRDTSWIRPGRVAWSWNVDITSPRSYSEQRRYADFAARTGRAHVLVDEGWSAAWVPRLVRYARRRGVSVWLWSQWWELRSRAALETSFARWRRWGVAGVKIDFTLCDCQYRMRWFDRVYRLAARERLMLNFHGTTVPRGVERTWPHVLTVEAVWGGETYNAFTRLGVPGPPQTAASLVTLPFTRNVVGPMDFTPVLLRSVNRDTSDGFELATAVVYESGLQHWGDGAQYPRRGPVADVLSRVPVAWDETRLLAGRPGRFAALARRRGREWWVGAISAGPSRAARLPLRFLGPGRWRMRYVTDGDAGGLGVRTVVVRRRDTLRTRLAANGGVTAWIVPAD